MNPKPKDIVDLLEDKTVRDKSETVNSDSERDPNRFHGPAFMKLTTQQRQQLIRMHNNLGHPDSQLLGNVLRDQGWDTSAIEGIKDMHCPSCVANTKPRISRPSHLTNPREFNELITVDGVEWTSAQGAQYYFYSYLRQWDQFSNCISKCPKDIQSPH